MTITISVKKIVAVAATALILWLAYYSNYLPLKKSQAFIDVLRGVGSVRSLPEFEALFDNVLAMPSPIGHEELVRNTGNSVMGIIQNAPQNSPVVPEMVRFMEKHFQPILESGQGMSFSQNLYLLGNMYEHAYFKTGNTEYLAKSKYYFLKGLELGPDRPQFLYGAFDVYRLGGDVENGTKIIERILSHWNDQRARDAYKAFIEETEKAKAAAEKKK